MKPLEVWALAKTGDLSGAETLINTTPLDCCRCVRIRGRIASLRQDWPAMDRWLGDAMQQAPSLPFAETEWGEALLAKGDIPEAVA